MRSDHCKRKRSFRVFRGCLQCGEHQRGCVQQNCDLGMPEKTLLCAAKLRLWTAWQNSISKSGSPLTKTYERYFPSLRTLKTQARAAVSEPDKWDALSKKWPLQTTTAALRSRLSKLSGSNPPSTRSAVASSPNWTHGPRAKCVADAIRWNQERHWSKSPVQLLNLADRAAAVALDLRALRKLHVMPCSPSTNSYSEMEAHAFHIFVFVQRRVTPQIIWLHNFASGPEAGRICGLVLVVCFGSENDHDNAHPSAQGHIW